MIGDHKLQFPICTKCGRMIEDTDKGFVVISLLIDSQLVVVFHRDVCDGEEIVMLDPVKILSERGLLPDGVHNID